MAKRKADFSARTKDLLAGRAGYKCSHPDCRHTTIGASAEGNNKTSSIGEAAHICAASPGGKRYDATMTDEERSSIDNGIWLCKTHARLIDTDETTYTVDLLKEWKRIAEFGSLQNLCSLNTIDRYFEKNSDDILVLADTLERCITEGEFKILSFLLSTYTCRLTETYDELILRYRIKYAVYYSKEYDNYETEEALFRLILIRYNNKQFYKDKYLEKAKKYTLNAKMLELVGATLEELNESNFIDFFIRSLLIDDSNSQLLKHIFIPLNELSSADDPKSVGENTVCTLSNGQDLFVAIHRSDVINGITPCELGNCKHFSVDEPIVAQLMFRTVGEKVSFFGNEYEIKNIESIYRFFSRLSMNLIITDPTFIKITGNIEDSIVQLTEITKQQSDAIKDKVDLYNDSAVPLPFSFLSSIIAKPKIETIDFLLHHNKKRICNNNNNFPAEPIKWYVLSFQFAF